MRRIRVVLASGVVMVAMLVAFQAPALAQDIDFDGFDDGDFFFDGAVPVEQSFDQEAESGDVDLSFETSNEGDNSNVTASALQFANTGNLQNAQGVLQFGSAADDIEFEGGSLEFSPSLTTDSNQAVRQSSSSRR